MEDSRPRILAVDDESDMLATYQSILRKKYSVLTAAGGEQALKIAAAESLSLVLLDLRMPGQDGIQVLKKIKKQDANLDVIMVTASKNVASAVEAMKLGALDYLTKPFDVKELMVLIEKALEKRELIRENLYLRESLKEITSYYDLIGKTPPRKKLYETIENYARNKKYKGVTLNTFNTYELNIRLIGKRGYEIYDTDKSGKYSSNPKIMFKLIFK